MRSIRSGRGLGDNLYMQSIVRHLVDKGERLEVCTDWPDVFRPLGKSIELSPHRRLGVTIVSHYTARKAVLETTQFEDCCINAGLREPVDLCLDWPPIGSFLPSRLKSMGKPIVVVQMPREPFGRADGYGMELLPRIEVLQAALDLICSRAVTVLIGAGEAKGNLSGVTIDLTNRTSVCDVLDLAGCADAFLGYCSFLVPLAESFSRRALLVWSRRGLQSSNDYIRTITPRKILHRQSSRAVIDDCNERQLREEIDALLEPAGSRRAVCR